VIVIVIIIFFHISKGNCFHPAYRTKIDHWYLSFS